jgi:hypothetical protein
VVVAIPALAQRGLARFIGARRRMPPPGADIVTDFWAKRGKTPVDAALRCPLIPQRSRPGKPEPAPRIEFFAQVDGSGGALPEPLELSHQTCLSAQCGLQGFCVLLADLLPGVLPLLPSNRRRAKAVL